MNVKKFLLSFVACVAIALTATATVPSSSAWLQYVCPSNPASTPLTVSFVFQNSTDLIVYDSKSSPPTALVLNSDYSVQGGGGSTGTITIIQGGQNAVQVGDVITIARNVPLTQLTTFTTTGPFNSTVVMQALDKLTMIVQQEQVQLNLALQFQPDETRSGLMALTQRENMSPAFDAYGNLIWVTPGSGGGGGGGGSGNYQIITQTNSFTAGEPVTVNASGVWVPALAGSTLNAANAIGVVSSINLTSGQFMVVQNGPCTVSTGNFSPGSIYYVPVSAGVITATPPSSTGQYLYPIATAISNSVVMVGISSPSLVVGPFTISPYSIFANNTASTAFPSSLSSSIYLGAPSFTDTGVVLQETGSVAGYFQNIIQNTSSSSAASADYIATNNLGTSSNYYIDFGINSSTYSGTGSFALANAGYLYTIPGDLVLGVWNTSGQVHFVIANSSGVSTADVAGIGSAGMYVNGIMAIGNAFTSSGIQLELYGGTAIVANGGAGLNINTQLTAAGSNTYNFENISATFNTSSYTSNILNSLAIGTPTISTTGGGSVTGGYQLNISAPASGQAGGIYNAGSTQLVGITGMGGAPNSGNLVNFTWTNASGDFFHAVDTYTSNTRTWAFGPGTAANHTFSFYDVTATQAVMEMGDGAYGTPFQVLFPASGGASFTGNLIATGGISFNGTPTGGAGQIWNSAANGLTMQGNTGSTNDWALLSQNGTVAAKIPTGTSAVTFTGLLTASGGITGSIGQTTAAAGSFTTLSASGTSTLTGNVTVGANGSGSVTNILQVAGSNAGAGSGPYLTWTDGTGTVGSIGSSQAIYTGSGRNVILEATNNLAFYPGDALALTLDTSQNATFAGKISVAGTSTLTGNVTVGGSGAGVLVYPYYSVSGLPSASSYTYGIVFVTDSTSAPTTGQGSAPSGSGSYKRPVYSNGTSWLQL